MKKYFSIVLLVLSLLAVNAIAFAEVTLQETRDLHHIQVNMAPIVVKSLEGEAVEGGIHRFSNMAALDEFLKGKNEAGLRVTNSYKPKLNVVIMDNKDVGNLVNLADMANITTLSRMEGPLYQIQEVPVEPPEQVTKKLNAIGMEEPVVLLVASGKKRIPGGIWKNIISQVITIVTLL